MENFLRIETERNRIDIDNSTEYKEWRSEVTGAEDFTCDVSNVDGHMVIDFGNVSFVGIEAELFKQFINQI